MSDETFKAIKEQWNYSNNFLKKALFNRYRELSESSDYDWFEFLEEEFGLDEIK